MRTSARRAAFPPQTSLATNDNFTPGSPLVRNRCDSSARRSGLHTLSAKDRQSAPGETTDPCPWGDTDHVPPVAARAAARAGRTEHPYCPRAARAGRARAGGGGRTSCWRPPDRLRTPGRLTPGRGTEPYAAIRADRYAACMRTYVRLSSLVVQCERMFEGVGCNAIEHMFGTNARSGPGGPFWQVSCGRECTPSNSGDFQHFRIQRDTNTCWCRGGHDWAPSRGPLANSGPPIQDGLTTRAGGPRA